MHVLYMPFGVWDKVNLHLLYHITNHGLASVSAIGVIDHSGILMAQVSASDLKVVFIKFAG